MTAVSTSLLGGEGKNVPFFRLALEHLEGAVHAALVLAHAEDAEGDQPRVHEPRQLLVVVLVWGLDD